MPAASEICWHCAQGVATVRDMFRGTGDVLQGVATVRDMFRGTGDLLRAAALLPCVPLFWQCPSYTGHLSFEPYSSTSTLVLFNSYRGSFAGDKTIGA